MRELKFRAWDNTEKDWTINIVECASASRWEIWLEPTFVSHEVIIEQYTGLKDKNGKEIYEGDIIKSSVHIGEVYQQGNGRWVIFCGKDKLHDGDLIVVGELECETYDLALTLGREHCKVIGNIHDNPELLGGTNATNKEEDAKD